MKLPAEKGEIDREKKYVPACQMAMLFVGETGKRSLINMQEIG